MTDTLTHTIIPAAQGWRIAVLIPSGPDRAAEFDEEPILAWCISADDYTPVPILLTGTDVRSISNAWLFRDPSDRYYDWFGSSFTTTEEAIALLTKRAVKLMNAR